MRLLYTCIFYIFIPVVLLRLLWRSWVAPAYAKRWGERFGFFSPLVLKDNDRDKKIVWLHTVSVGEFLGALPLIKRLVSDSRTYLVITTTTPTGSERVRATLGKSVFHVYAPYDLPDVLSRFLSRINPSLLLVMETELWPNTLAACHKAGVPSVLINARLSEKSARGYARFEGLTRPMLQNLSRVAIQNPTDAARFVAIGLPESRITVTGNIKFDLTLTDELRQKASQLKSQWSIHGERLVFIAASTHQGEDEIILDALSQLRSSAHAMVNRVLLVLVPRHPERFERVGQLCSARGFAVSKRSSGVISPETDVVLGDTMGELLLMFGASDVAFVGGSFVPNGGHNFVEPAVWSLPLLSGESVFNFAEVSQLLRTAGALVQVSSAEALASECELLLANADVRQARGNAALQVTHDNRGALDKTLAVIEKYL